MAELPRPPDVKRAVDGIVLRRSRACADRSLIDEAVRRLKSDADAPPVETAIVYGFARAAVDDFARDAELSDVLSAMSTYMGVVASLHYRAWVLHEDIQVLKFRLAAAGANSPASMHDDAQPSDD